MGVPGMGMPSARWGCPVMGCLVGVIGTKMPVPGADAQYRHAQCPVWVPSTGTPAAPWGCLVPGHMVRGGGARYWDARCFLEVPGNGMPVPGGGGWSRATLCLVVGCLVGVAR